MPGKKHNLTITLDADLLHEARKYALEHRTSVNQIVRDHLLFLVERTRRQRLQSASRLVEMMESGLYERTETGWKREDLYADRLGRWD